MTPALGWSPFTNPSDRRFTMFYDVYGPSWSPFSDVERMLDDLGRAYGRSRRLDGTALNVWANDEAVAVTAEVPGVDPGSIDLSIVGDTLTVAGKREVGAAEAKEANWHRRE